MNNLKDNYRDVIERNIDAYKGYQKAADKVSDTKLANTFRKEANQRRKFAMDLEREVNVFSEDDFDKIKDGTFEGSMHRTWIGIKTTFSTDKDESIVEECINGEKNSLEEYDELINENTLVGVPSELIIKQRNEVQRTINELQRLEAVLD